MTKKLLALCAALILPSLGLATQYANVAIVAKSGGDYLHPVDALNSLASWCPSPSATSPCLVKILPGVYDLAERTPAQLAMRSHVDVEGSGASGTTLKASSGYPVFFATGTTAELRALAVETTAASNALGYGAGIFNADATLRDVVLRVSGGYAAKGVMIQGSPGAPAYGAVRSVLLERVTVSVSGSTSINYGVDAGRIDLTLRDCDVSVSGGSEAYALLVRNPSTAGSTVDVVDSTIRATLGVSTTRGVVVSSSREVNLTGSRVEATGSGSTAALHVSQYQGLSPTVRLDGCRVAAGSAQPASASVYAFIGAGPVLLVGASRLDGSIPPPGGNGVATCVASYTGGYQPLDGQCQPLP
jgi:hypothetical protein